MFMFKKRKQRKDIINRMQKMAALLHEADFTEMGDKFYEIRDILKKQNKHSKSWRDIDEEIYKRLKEIEKHIENKYIKTTDNYEQWIRKWVKARGEKESFEVTPNECNAFENKNEELEEVDKTVLNLADLKEKLKKILKELVEIVMLRDEIIEKAVKLPLTHPQVMHYASEIDDCGMDYNMKLRQSKQFKDTIRARNAYLRYYEDGVLLEALYNEADNFPEKLNRLAVGTVITSQKIAENTRKVDITIRGVDKSNRDATSDAYESGMDAINKARETAAPFQGENSLATTYNRINDEVKTEEKKALIEE